MPSRKANVKNEKQYEAMKDRGCGRSGPRKMANSPDASKHGGEKSHPSASQSDSSRAERTLRRSPPAARAAKPQPARSWTRRRRERSEEPGWLVVVGTGRIGLQDEDLGRHVGVEVHLGHEGGHLAAGDLGDGLGEFRTMAIWKDCRVALTWLKSLRR